MLNKIILYTYNPKIRIPFFLSPFILAFIGFFLTAILAKNSFSQNTFAFIPLFVAIAYFIFWGILMYIRAHFIFSEDGIKKRDFVSWTQISNNFLNEARKQGWSIKEKKSLGGDLGFTIEGNVEGTPFKIERTRPIGVAHSNSLLDYMTCIYIDTKKREDFEVKPQDITKNLSKNSLKDSLISQTKDNLSWLMITNKFIQKVGFYKGSFGAIIWDEINTPAHLTEIIKKLLKIKRVYDKF
jgi:hypothetical protein